MGKKYRDLVTQYSTQKRGRRSVLNVLASFANDDGEVWIGNETIAMHAGLSVRAVQYNIDALLETDELEIIRAGNGRGNTTVYQLKHAKLAPFIDEKRVQDTTEKGASSAIKGASSAIKGAKNDNAYIEDQLDLNNINGDRDDARSGEASLLSEAEPKPPPTSQSSPPRIDLDSRNNFDGPKATKGIPEMERTTSVSRHRARQRRDSEHLYNPRKLKSKRVPTGEGETACEILFEFVPYDPQRISNSMLERVHFEVTDLAKWRQTLARVDGRGWLLYNIADRLDVYKNGFKYEGNGNGHQSSSNRNGTGASKRPAWADYQESEYDEEWAKQLNGWA